MEKRYLDFTDIMKLYNCGRNKALLIIRSIKVCSDTLNIKGRVTTYDLEYWEKCRGQKEVNGNKYLVNFKKGVAEFNGVSYKIYTDQAGAYIRVNGYTVYLTPENSEVA